MKFKSCTGHPFTITEIVDAEFSYAAIDGGAVETLERQVTIVRNLLKFVVAQLPDDAQQTLAEQLGYRKE